jgi:hypothetical protein
LPKKTFTPEQIVNKLRQVEVLVSQGKTVPLACKEAGMSPTNVRFLSVFQSLFSTGTEVAGQVSSLFG